MRGILHRESPAHDVLQVEVVLNDDETSPVRTGHNVTATVRRGGLTVAEFPEVGFRPIARLAEPQLTSISPTTTMFPPNGSGGHPNGLNTSSVSGATVENP